MTADLHFQGDAHLRFADAVEKLGSERAAHAAFRRAINHTGDKALGAVHECRHDPPRRAAISRVFGLPSREAGLTDQPIADAETAKGAFAKSGRASLPTGWVRPLRYRACPSYHVKYDRAADLAREIGPSIIAGDRVDCLLSGNFIFGDLFEALAIETNEPIDDLTLSTLSLGEENVVGLGRLLRAGWLGTLAIVISDYWWAHNRRNADFVAEHLDVEGRFALAVAGTHTKVALLEMGDRKIVAHGSANLRSSRSVETLTIETNPALFDFHRRWHDAIIADYAVTGTVRRAAATFDLVGGMA